MEYPVRTVIARLNRLEWRFYPHQVFELRERVQHRVRNGIIGFFPRDNFLYREEFERLRLACLLPGGHKEEEEFVQDQGLVRRLYELKSDMDHMCLICHENGERVDSITTCGHAFCFGCFIHYFNLEKFAMPGTVDLMAARCPTCRGIVYKPDDELTFLSSKQKFVIYMVQYLLRVWNGQPRKIVVASSHNGTLLWLHNAFLGLGITSTLCARHNVESINEFVNNPNISVLLIGMREIKTKIKLPRYSHLIVMEAMVFDVQRYIFENIKTRRRRDTLQRTVLIAQGTIEEAISREPHHDDYFESYDINCRFIGPSFRHHRDIPRLVSIQERAPDFVVGWNYEWSLEGFDARAREFGYLEEEGG
ncbi:hypothetical protein A2U01_0000999, partial [Trifolium medium]|nr:hypothetical protein [Trifolium medium]